MNTLSIEFSLWDLVHIIVAHEMYRPTTNVRIFSTSEMKEKPS